LTPPGVKRVRASRLFWGKKRRSDLIDESPGAKIGVLK